MDNIDLIIQKEMTAKIFGRGKIAVLKIEITIQQKVQKTSACFTEIFTMNFW